MEASHDRMLCQTLAKDNEEAVCCWICLDSVSDDGDMKLFHLGCRCKSVAHIKCATLWYARRLLYSHTDRALPPNVSLKEGMQLCDITAVCSVCRNEIDQGLVIAIFHALQAARGVGLKTNVTSQGNLLKFEADVVDRAASLLGIMSAECLRLFIESTSKLLAAIRTVTVLGHSRQQDRPRGIVAALDKFVNKVAGFFC